MRRAWRGALAALLACAPGASRQDDAASGSAAAPLALVKEIELPGVGGRIDHLAVDLARGRLWIAALGNDSVEVVDLKAAKHLKSLPGPREPQGIAFLADSDRVAVACGEGGDVIVFDAGSFETVAKVAVGDDADNVRYDASAKRLYVAYGRALAVVDAERWEVEARIALDGHPEAFHVDAARHRAYVNVPSAREVAVVDLERGAVDGAWKVGEAGSNYPMAWLPAERAGAAGGGDGGGALLLLGCRSPAELVQRALPGGTAAGTVALSGDCDDLFFDARRGRVYAACGEGFVDVLAREPGGSGGLARLARVPTAGGARTCLFVPERDEVFVAAPRRGGEPARVLVLAARD